jgi:hypothetical protein
MVYEDEFVYIALVLKELELDEWELKELVNAKLEVLELNLEKEVDVDVMILDEDEFANIMLLVDGSRLELESFELGVLVLDDKERLVVHMALVVILGNAVVVLLIGLVVVVLELLFDEMELGECELVELANAELEMATREEDNVIGDVVDEDEFRNLAMLLVELRLLAVLIAATELVVTAFERLVDAVEEVLR